MYTKRGYAPNYCSMCTFYKARVCAELLLYVHILQSEGMRRIIVLCAHFTKRGYAPNYCSMCTFYKARVCAELLLNVHILQSEGMRRIIALCAHFTKRGYALNYCSICTFPNLLSTNFVCSMKSREQVCSWLQYKLITQPQPIFTTAFRYSEHIL